MKKITIAMEVKMNTNSVNDLLSKSIFNIVFDHNGLVITKIMMITTAQILKVKP
jgi:hypothetical protein